MNAAEEIARQSQMGGVMLKCQKANPAAHEFYSALGYEIDELSPSSMGYKTADHEILSLHFA